MNATEFIGSKICLISKSEIRYEGILYSIDLAEATISLAKVRSFGTEDRVTNRPVPPRQEIYEFIIFRGSDIKAIDVIEAPPKGDTSGIPNDPAIVEVSHYTTPHNQQGSSSQPFGPSTSAILSKSSSSSTQQPSNSELLASLDQAGGISIPLSSLNETSSTHNDTSRSNVSTPSGHGNRKSPTNDAGVQASDRGRNYRQQNNNNRQPNNNVRRNNSPRQNQQRRGGGPQYMMGQGQGQQQRGRNNYLNNNRSGGSGGFRGGRGPMMMRGGRGMEGGGGGYRPRAQGIIPAQMPAKISFTEDFDFEKANAEIMDSLSKLTLGKKESDSKEEQPRAENGEATTEHEEQENKEPVIYYTKDNFFDNISCEASERNKGATGPRVDWKAERKLNAETFGVSGPGPRRGGYYRGPRGYRGYNNPRGGGYQYGRGYGYGGYNSGSYYNRYNGGGRGGNRGA